MQKQASFILREREQPCTDDRLPKTAGANHYTHMITPKVIQNVLEGFFSFFCDCSFTFASGNISFIYEIVTVNLMHISTHKVRKKDMIDNSPVIKTNCNVVIGIYGGNRHYIPVDVFFFDSDPVQ